MNNAAAAQADKSASESAAEALSADDAQQERPERKADCMRRSEEAGLWEEANEFRTAERTESCHSGPPQCRSSGAALTMTVCQKVALRNIYIA